VPRFNANTGSTGTKCKAVSVSLAAQFEAETVNCDDAIVASIAHLRIPKLAH
jgi:hypothetical protein